MIMDALKRGRNAHPANNMKDALIFQAVMALIAMPFPLCLGLFGRKGQVRRKRWEMDRGGVEDGGYAEEEDERVLRGQSEVQ